MSQLTLYNSVELKTIKGRCLWAICVCVWYTMNVNGNITPELMRIKPYFFLLNSHGKTLNKHFIAFGATKGYK